MKYFYFAMIVILPLLISALTIDEAINLALENNKELLMAKDDVKIANREYKNIRGSLLPQVTGQAGVYNSHTNLPDKAELSFDSVNDLLDSPSDNEQTLAGFIDNSLPEMESDVTEYGATLKIDQVLYLGGKLLAGIKAAKKYEHLTENQYKVKETDVVFETKKLYYGTLLAAEALEINRKALETAKKHLARVTILHEEGIVSDYDFLRAKLEVSKLQPQVVEADNNYIMAKEALAKQLGVTVTEINTQGKIEFSPKETESIDKSIEIAKENRPELTLTTLMKEMYQLQYKAERGNFLPNIAFSAEFTHYAQGDDQFSLESDDFGTSYRYGIGMQLPIFTGFSNLAKKEKAYYQLQQAKVKDADLTELITLDVRNSYLNYQHALENLNVQTENISLAEKALSIAETRFENSIGIQLEVFDAQLQVNITSLSLLSAKYNALMAYEAYQKSIGNY